MYPRAVELYAHHYKLSAPGSEHTTARGVRRRAKVRRSLIVKALSRRRLVRFSSIGLGRNSGLSSDHFDRAESMIGKHGFSTRLRTLDALQLAVALDLREQGNT